MTTILIKKKDTAGAPAPGDLTNATGGTEIAVNTSTKRVYTKDSGGTVVELGSSPSSMAVQGNLSATGTLNITGATTLSSALTYGGITLANAVTGTGAMVLATSPALVTPALGTPTALVGTNITGTAAAFNINGTVGATTPATGAFTTLSATTTAAADALTITNSGSTPAALRVYTGSTSFGVAIGDGPTGSGESLIFNPSTNQVVVNTSSANRGVFSSTGLAVTGALSYTTTLSGGTGVVNLGSGQFYKDASGNVGIGTATPTGFGTGYTTIDTRGASGSGIKFGTATTEAYTYTDSTGFFLATTGAIPIRFAINGTERMYLDSSGNLGIGITPNAWYVATANARTLQINNASFYADSNNGTSIASNWLFDTAGAQKYLSNGYATRFLQTSGQYQWLTAPSGTAGNAITFTQAMTLDASGRRMLGTTTAMGLDTVSTTTNNGTAVATNSTDFSGAITVIHNQDNATTGNKVGLFFGHAEPGLYSGIASTKLNGTWQTTLDFYVNNITGGSTTQIQLAARIDSSGNLGIGTTSPVGKLQIKGTDPIFRMESPDNSMDIKFTTSGGVSTQRISIGQGAGSENLVVLNSGNVGIGTTSPSVKLEVNGLIKGKGYTVSTLPTGVVGARAYVTDALTPAYMAIAVGGGAITTPVFYTGANWVTA